MHMASIPTTHLWVFSLVVVALFAQDLLLPVVGDERLVRSSCRRTEYPDVCTSFLLANSSSLGADVVGLATITGEGLLVKSILATDCVGQVANATTEPFLKRILQDCHRDFQLSVRHLRLALDYLAARQLWDAKSFIAWPLSSVSTCHDIVGTYNFTYPPAIIEKENGIERLTIITVELINIILPP